MMQLLLSVRIVLWQGKASPAILFCCSVAIFLFLFILHNCFMNDTPDSCFLGCLKFWNLVGLSWKVFIWVNDWAKQIYSMRGYNLVILCELVSVVYDAQPKDQLCLCLFFILFFSFSSIDIVKLLYDCIMNVFPVYRYMSCEVSP